MDYKCLLVAWTLKRKRVSRNLVFQELRKKERETKVPREGVWISF